MIIEQLLRRIPFCKELRPYLEEHFDDDTEIVWRNYEMSRTVRELAPLFHFPTTTILQEYFVPVDYLETFIENMRTIIHHNDINVLNISIRYVKQDTESLLAYAPQESFALVMYINIWNTDDGKTKAQQWTEQLIDAALEVGGTYFYRINCMHVKINCTKRILFGISCSRSKISMIQMQNLKIFYLKPMHKNFYHMQQYKNICILI